MRPIDTEVDEFFKRLSELRYAIDLDIIGKTCRKYEVTISTTWSADGSVEFFCCPWQTDEGE